MKAINSKYKPKISVVIPAYNEENIIKNTLISVTNQKCNIPFEIVVVDGQSTDRTVSIARKFAKVYISPQKGKAYQLNYAAQKTSGDLFLFLDADTLIEPFFLHKIYKIFKRNKNLLACSARTKYYDGIALSFNMGSLKCMITKYFFQNLGSHLYYFFKSLVGYPELSGTNMIVRRDIFFKTGGFKQPPNSLGIDKVFSDSLIYLTRKLKKGKIKTLTFISALTSGRNLTVKRSFKRIHQYFSKKNMYYELAKKVE